ncbi:MAG: PD-(D/E)XK nuclease family protein [Bacilli bacterium]
MLKVEENDIIITNNKEKIIKENTLRKFKVFTPNEIELYKEKDDAILYITKKYNMLPENAHIILKNLRKIELKDYNNQKLNDLVSIKKDLIENKKLIKNIHLETFLKDKKVILYDLDPITQKELSTKLNIKEIINEEPKKTLNKNVYEYATLEDEIVGLATKIRNLIIDGININNIKITTVDNDYLPVIQKIFNIYNIGLNLKNNNKLFYIDEVKSFLENIDDDTNLIDLNDTLKFSFDVQTAVVNIINKYTNYETIGEIKPILEYEFKNTTLKSKKINCVKEIDYKTHYNNNDYVFMIGFNQEIIPVIYKDDQYLSEKESKLLGLSTIEEKNQNEEYILNKFINNTKNLSISYKLKSITNDYAPSDFLAKITNLNIIKEEYDYKNEILNKLKLAENLDIFIKYQTIKEPLEELYSYYDIPYNIYDNNYNKINYETIKKELKNKLNLSYSNMDTFFRCSFRFLLNNIYKLEPFTETTATILGKVFHEVLEKKYSQNLTDYENTINESFNKYFESPTKKDLFYLKKWSKAIMDFIEILDARDKISDFAPTYLEEKFEINIKDDLNIKIKGFVDKILTFENNVVVIDYKTGSSSHNLNNAIYGLDMQLLMYLYLIKNTTTLTSPKIAGMYIQSVMNEVEASKTGKTQKELNTEKRKLEGYTLKNSNIASKLDHNFENESFVKSLRVKQDGEFYATSSVLTEEQIESFIEIVDKNIKNVINDIHNTNFEINPKKLENELEGCKYCNFKDICYMTNENIKELKKYKKFEFLGGENDDTN